MSEEILVHRTCFYESASKALEVAQKWIDEQKSIEVVSACLSSVSLEVQQEGEDRRRKKNNLIKKDVYNEKGKYGDVQVVVCYKHI
ncbi:MAG: hypothetical protein KAR54_00525 [Candidatus Pacebacteria bacterium]|nr:hypothetical protein [Candidatus Paceibacterota bacterium]